MSHPMSNFRTAFSSVAVTIFLSRRGRHGGCTNRRPHDCPGISTLPSPLAVVAVVIDAIEEAGVHGVRGGGDMGVMGVLGVIGVLGHTLGELGVVFLCCVCRMSSLRLFADAVEDDRTSCLSAAKLSFGVPGVTGVCRPGERMGVIDGESWYSLRTTTRDRCSAFRRRRSETYSRAGRIWGGRWWASRMEVPASSGEDILSLRDMVPCCLVVCASEEVC